MRVKVCVGVCESVYIKIKVSCNENKTKFNLALEYESTYIYALYQMVYERAYIMIGLSNNARLDYLIILCYLDKCLYKCPHRIYNHRNIYYVY